MKVNERTVARGASTRRAALLIRLFAPLVLACDAGSSAIDARSDHGARVKPIESHRAFSFNPDRIRRVSVSDASQARYVRILNGLRLIVAGNSSHDLRFIDMAAQMPAADPVAPRDIRTSELIRGVFPCANDSVLVAYTHGRWDLFDALGRAHRRRAAQSGAWSTVYGVARDCSAVFTVTPVRESTPEGVRLELAWIRVRDGAVVPVVSTASSETTKISYHDRILRLPLPFGRVSSWATDGEVTYLGEGAKAEVRSFDSGGRPLSSRSWDAPPNAVTWLDRIRYELARRNVIRRFGEDAVVDIPPYTAFNLPKFKPLYAGFLTDDEGRLWVRSYPSTWEGFERIFGPGFASNDTHWLVFNRDGQYVGHGFTPANYVVTDFRNGSAAGIGREGGLYFVFLMPLSFYKDLSARDPS